MRHLETCDTCTGSGVKPGSKVRSCGTCGGQGIVAQVTRTPLGNFQTQTTCPTCRGTGEQVGKSEPRSRSTRGRCAQPDATDTEPDDDPEDEE